MPTTVSTGYPDDTNTGVQAGVTLTTTLPKGASYDAYGDLIITQAGTYSNLHITGEVIVEVSGVTLENCSINSGGYYGVYIHSGETGTVVQHCTITGGGSTNDLGQQGILGQGTFNDNNISDFVHGINVTGPSTIEGNYIHGLAGDSSILPHYDGIEDDGGASNITITNNTVVNTQGQTSAIMLDNQFGPVSNITISNNVLSGGDYTIYVDGGKSSTNPMTNISITNNHMGAGTYGYTDFNRTSPTYTGNVNDAAPIIATLDSPTNNGGGSPPPPAAPIITSFSPETNGVDTTSTVTLTGTAVASSTVTVYDRTVDLGATQVGASGNWSFTENNAANGVHTFTATDTDANGTSAASSGFPVTVNVSSSVPPPAQTNLVVNGGSETGNLTGWTSGSYQPDQTLITTNSHSGQYAAALGPAGADGSLSQTLATTPGQTYTLEFWLANVSSGPNDFSAHWGSTTEMALVNQNAFGYTEYVFDVTAASTSTLLQFDYRQDPTQWRLDNVSVTAGAAKSGLTVLGAPGGGSTLTNPAGTNSDILTGNGNGVTFVFPGASFGKDTITDFQTGSSHDTIQFNHTVFANFAAVHAHAAQVGSNTVITIDAADSVTLVGVALSSLHSADFHFI
jgi:hypothetical protein